MQYIQDRDNADLAKDSWKTMRQLMYNDLANTIDSEEMVSRYGPTAWGRELFTLGMLNNRLGALSAVPPYMPQQTGFPVPAVNPALAMAGPLSHALPLPGAAGPIMASPLAGPAPLAAAAAVNHQVQVQAHAHAHAAAAARVTASMVHDVPISVGLTIAGYTILHYVGPVEGIAPPSMAVMDLALQRLTAVELLVRNAALVGANGVVNLRLVHDGVGDIIATGEAVRCVPGLM